MNPFLFTDAYKTGHHRMYPDGTDLVYSNITPRSNKYAPSNVDKVLVSGTQMTIHYLVEKFNTHFFDDPNAVKQIKEEYSNLLGIDYDASHIQGLHDLGYLPLLIKSIPEGERVPFGVPVMTVLNTAPEHYWLTNAIETMLSNLIWKGMTSATIAYEYRVLLERWAEQTDPENKEFVKFQGHDFSLRGLSGDFSSFASSLGHATCFLGSDNLPAIEAARRWYGATGPVIFSVPATEHSVMCAGEKDTEGDTFDRLMNIFPEGILSVVSDTWDLWNVLENILPERKEKIMAREGKLVIRPDSGNPADILCGEPLALGTKGKGVIESLWDTFGGTVNKQGYKVLDSHIGAIYGDSITLDRANEICKRLKEKGFASTNVVLGIGSYTYQYNTRDTLGFAMKSTYVEVNGESRELFKDPITDDGTKKSAKGLLRVFFNDEGDYTVTDGMNWLGENDGELQTLFKDGKFYNELSFDEIREKVDKSL